jgi:anti-sigma factor RsiW
MTECRWAGETGSYLDDEMTAEALTGFEAHLPECPRCQSELASLRRLSSVVGLVQPEVGTKERVLSRLPFKWWRQPVRLTRGVAVGLTLALALSFSINLLLFGRLSREVQPRPPAPVSLSSNPGVSLRAPRPLAGAVDPVGSGVRLLVRPKVSVGAAQKWGTGD